MELNSSAGHTVFLYDKGFLYSPLFFKTTLTVQEGAIMTIHISQFSNWNRLYVYYSSIQFSTHLDLPSLKKPNIVTHALHLN